MLHAGVVQVRDADIVRGVAELADVLDLQDLDIGRERLEFAFGVDGIGGNRPNEELAV